DGLTLASGSFDKSVRLWDVKTGQARTILQGHTSPVNSVVFSPDGLTVASGGSGPTRAVLPATPVGGRGSMDGMGPLRAACMVHPKQQQVAQIGEVRLWDVKTGQLKAALHGHTSHIMSVAFSPDGLTLASAGGGAIDAQGQPLPDAVRLWD